MTQCQSRTLATCVVRAITPGNPGYYRLDFSNPWEGAPVRAGQFLHILCRDAAARDPLLRRAFSIMELTPETVSILFRVEGRGTSWLSRLTPGDNLSILGPLGTPWDTTGLAATENAVLIGGGVGVPPLVMLAHQVSRETPFVKMMAIIGARNLDGLIGVDALRQLGVEVHVTTEDGSAGLLGRVTDSLTLWLNHRQGASSSGPQIFTCGPLPMLRAVALLAESANLSCQVSMEENMPCGIGVCNGCVVATRSNGEFTDYERYSRICVHGPVMESKLVDWEVTR